MHFRTLRVTVLRIVSASSLWPQQDKQVRYQNCIQKTWGQIHNSFMHFRTLRVTLLSIVSASSHDTVSVLHFYTFTAKLAPSAFIRCWFNGKIQEHKRKDPNYEVLASQRCVNCELSSWFCRPPFLVCTGRPKSRVGPEETWQFFSSVQCETNPVRPLQ